MFANTSGELAFTPDQQNALIAFVNGGKGFIGTHSATDTLYGWPDYGRLVGAYFNEHPWTQQGRVIVEDAVASRGWRPRSRSRWKRSSTPFARIRGAASRC